MYRCKCGVYTDNGFFCLNCQSSLMDLDRLIEKDLFDDPEEELEEEGD